MNIQKFTDRKIQYTLVLTNNVKMIRLLHKNSVQSKASRLVRERFM